MKYLFANLTTLALALAASLAQAQTTINTVYFGQTHVLKATDPYFGLVANREALIKVHVVNPATPASPAVTATLTLSGQPNQVLTLTGPATLPASIPDGLGVVQHSYANTFTGIIPATYVKKGLQITVNAGTASTSITNLDIGAPTKVIMTMFDVQYFADTNDNYPANTFAELEAKWPVADLEVRRVGHVVFPELVIPPRQDVGTKAVRIKSKAEYQAQTGKTFDGEQSAALEWNGALKRAAGQSGRWSLYYINVYNAFAGGQAGGFGGVGSGTSVGILHHELGHALSLPHWGDSGAYPYKGDMHGIQAPSNYNETHAGPAWAFHLPTRAFIPPTVQASNVGGKPVGTYKVDPMQGGGTGWQEPAYLMNHFSDYSVNQMRDYLQGHVVAWNSTLNSWAQWNQTAGDYTTTVSNNGVNFPTTRDVQVISIMASVSGSNPGINMVYPPIGPYTSGLIRLFDPTVAADRTSAQSIFSPTSGSDYCVRVVQGGVTKTYMLAASNLTSVDPFSESSLITEAINLPASGGTVTKIELLSTPNAEDVGLPANPTVLYTWAPLMPEPGTFELPPTANSSSAITMTALPGEVAFGQTGGTVEYLFTETTGNPGATDSAWQTSRTYTDTGLQAGTTYSYTVSIRAGTLATTASAPASATTSSASFAGTITVLDTQQFALDDASGYRPVTGLGTFNPGGADKLVVVVSGENKNNDHFSFSGVRYNGVQMIEAVQQTGGTADGAVAIYYLDNPGAITSGINVSCYNPNGGVGTAYALSGTRPGFGAFNSRKGNFLEALSLTTSANKSLVIAGLANSGNPSGATAPTLAAPFTLASSGTWGGSWGSHASGYDEVATPGSTTATFNTSTSSTHSINIALVEFLAETTPGSTWVQTLGGAQNWTTGANWITGSAPAPLAGDTVDFSTVNIAANTTVTLGADRTGGLWKFGDTTGAETWTINSGNTITLSGTTPTMEVVNNSAQLNCVVAGTAGLTKTGAGTLLLNASNTYGGVTRINAGTLQVTTLANGGSNSSIGSASTAATNLILNGGTLENIGAGGSTNRLFSLQASSTIDASGTGAVNFTNASPIGFNSSTTAKTLTLDGTNTDANNITAIIGDNTGITTLTKSGTGTWVLSGANTYTGATIINGGTLRLANLAAVQDSSQVNINNGTNAGTLQLSTNTAFTTFPLLGGGSSAQGTILSDRASAGAGLTHALGAANFGTNTYNFAAGTNVTSGTAGISFTSASLSGGGNGTTVFNPTTANLTIIGAVSIPSGGTTKTLSLSGTSSANFVGGGITDGIGTLSLTKSNTSTWTLSGLSATAANNYSGTTIIDNGTLRITTTSPSLEGGLTFGAAAGGTNVGALDLSAASATFGGAFLVRTDSTTANTVSLGSGRTLQLNGSVTVGYNSAANSTTRLNVTGLGTLSFGTSGAPTNANVQIGNGGTTQISNAGTLDLSGLSTFFANLGTGTFRIGSPTNSGGVSAGGSTVILAANSTIQADKLLLASPDSSSSTQSLKLGSGTNVLNVNTIHITGTGDLFSNTNGRSTGSLTFNGAAGSLTLRGLAGGTSRSDLNVGWSNMNTANSPTGTFDTTGHAADLRIGTMTLGRRTTNSAAGTVSGLFNFNQGTLDADNLIVALVEVGASSSGTVSLGGGSSIFNNIANPIRLGENITAGGVATGTLNISGLAIVNVAASGGTSIRLANATVAGGTATGNLNLTGGTLTVAGDILRGANTGTSNATVKLSGGTLNMGGHDIGSAGTGAVTFTVESGTLQNVATINGTGGLTKTTAGVLTLSGTNNYTGGTTLSAGTLALGTNNALPATALSIGSATLNAATFTDTLGTLDVTGTSVINLGSAAVLTFADSSAIDWTGGTLTLTGTFVSGSSLRFGTTSGGLTPAQLSQISAPGFPGFTLNSSGYLITIPNTITNTTTDVNGTCTPTGVTQVALGGSQTYTLTPNPEYTVGTLTVNGVPVPPALSYTFNNVSENQTINATFVLATTLYWDSNSTTPGFGNSTGTWGASQFWSVDAIGSSVPLTISTTPNSSVNFGTATLNYNPATVTVASGGVNVGNITFGAGQSTPLTLSGGTITLGDTAVITVNNTSNTIASVLAGAGSSLTKAGTGNLTLSTANNTYTGITTIAAGTLAMASNLITGSPAISIGNGATLNVTGSGGFTLAANQSVAGTGTTGFVSTTTSTGLITNALGGNTIGSSGTLTLTRLDVRGANNQITGGDIQSGGTGSFQRGLLVGNTVAGTLTINGGSLTTNGSVTTNADILGNGASGNGTLVINGGSYLATGGVGQLSLGNTVANGGGGTLTLTSGIASLKTLVYQAGSSQSAIVNLDGGTLTLSNITVASGLTKEFNFNGGQFVAGTALPAFSGLTMNVKNGGAKINTNGFSFAISDPLVNFGGASTGGLNKSGAGTLTLTGPNTYAGGTTVTAGVLQIGNGGTTGSLSSSSVISNNASLVFNRSNAVTQGTDFASSITGSGSLTQTGTGILTLNSANTYSGLTTVTAGSLKILNEGALGTTAAGTVVNGSTSDSTANARLELEGDIMVTGEALILNGVGNNLGALASTSGNNTWAGNVTIGSASTRLGASSGTTLRVSGTVDSGAVNTGLIIGTQDLTATVILSGANTYLGDTNILIGKLQLDGGNNRLPVATRMTFGSGTNSAEFDLNGRNQEIAGLAITPGATAASNSVNNSSATLATLTVNTATPSSFAGILNGNLALVKTGTDTLTLSGLSTYAGPTRIDNGLLRLGVNDALPTGTALSLGSGTTVGGCDLATFNQTLANLTANSDSTSANTLSIGSGKSLTVAGDFTVGFNSAANTTTKLVPTGLGTLSITAGNFQLGGSITSGVGNAATLDMSGLSNFSYTNSTGIFRVGDATNSSSSGTGSSTLILANNSTITAATFTMNSPTSVPHEVRLGSGLNTINADTIQIGATTSRSPGILSFNSPTGTLALRNTAGTGEANMTVGYSSANTAVTNTSSLDLTGVGRIGNDLQIGTLQIGGRTNGTAGGAATATFSFDAGVLSATSITLGDRRGTIGTGTGTVTGTLNLGGGVVTVSSNLAMASNTSTVAGNIVNATVNISGGTVNFGANSGTSVTLGSNSSSSNGGANATLNLTGGTVTLTGDIAKGPTTGTVTSTLKLSGGTLDMGGNDIGATGSGAITLTAESGTLRNVATINGSGGLTKTTTGTLTLAGTNTYTGVTNLSEGVISLGSASALGSTSANTIVAPGAEIFAGAAMANTTIAEPFNIAGTGVTGAIHIGNSITGMTFSGAITLSADARIQSDGSTSSFFTGAINTNGFALSFNGSGTVGVGTNGISGTGSVIKNTGGILTFNVANTFTGTTAVNAGTLNLNAVNALASSSGITIATGANLQEQEIAGSMIGDSIAVTVNGAYELDKNETIGGLAGSGVVTAKDLNNDNASTESWILTLGGGNATGSFSGILQDNGTDAKLVLTKTGTGNQTLSGVSTYTGTTTISAGTLTIDEGSISTSGNIVNNAAMVYNLTTNARTYANVISGTGTLTKNGTNSLTLSGANTYTGNTVVNAGALTLADNAQLRFVIGATSGTNNRITGTGTITINGDFNIDTSLADASALTSGSWTLVDAATLTENFGASFTILGTGWSETSNVWSKTAGTKKYTFTDATGILALTQVDSYTSWISGFFPGESNQSIIGASADPDKDGISNGVEMVIGGNPKTGMDTALLPTLALVTNPVSTPAIPAGKYMLFTYRRSDLSVSSGVAADCETSPDLKTPWTPATGAPGVVIQVDNNFTFTPPATAATDRVRVYVPCASNSSLYGRLKVLVP